MAKEKTYRVSARCYVNVYMVVSATSKENAKSVFEGCPGMWSAMEPYQPHCVEVTDITKARGEAE